MNREIEFRAWDIENKIMVYDNENDTYGYWDGCRDSDLGMINYLLNRKEYIFMQYTGLKDKNGKKIFEGDIIKYTDEVPYTVMFDPTGYWRLDGNGARNSEMLIQYDDTNNYIEVIGNIYENNLESKGNE